MATLFKRQLAVPSPKIIEVTLLSEEEYEACRNYIKLPQFHEVRAWYLRTPYNEDGEELIKFVNGDDLDDPTYPSFDDYESGWMTCGTGLRPVLRIESLVLSDTVTLKPGDTIYLGNGENCENGHPFTVISDTLLLSDWYIGDCSEYDGGYSYGCFDSNDRNIYEESEAKRRVDAWFEKNIKPYVESENEMYGNTDGFIVLAEVGNADLYTFKEEVAKLVGERPWNLTFHNNSYIKKFNAKEEAELFIQAINAIGALARII